jgi:F0F1-type ATP synthase epsilon subunit
MEKLTVQEPVLDANGEITVDENGIVVTTNRDMNAAEIANYQAIKASAEAQKVAEEKATNDKIAAQAKLEALGLTADDLKALGL